MANAMRLTFRDGNPAVNEEAKLNYTFADADEGLPRRHQRMLTPRRAA